MKEKERKRKINAQHKSEALQTSNATANSFNHMIARVVYTNFELISFSNKIEFIVYARIIDFHSAKIVHFIHFDCIEDHAVWLVTLFENIRSCIAQLLANQFRFSVKTEKERNVRGTIRTRVLSVSVCFSLNKVFFCTFSFGFENFPWQKTNCSKVCFVCYWREEWRSKYYDGWT